MCSFIKKNLHIEWMSQEQVTGFHLHSEMKAKWMNLLARNDGIFLRGVKKFHEYVIKGMQKVARSIKNI